MKRKRLQKPINLANYLKRLPRLADKQGNGYALTGKGLGFIDSELIVSRANNNGSDLHIRLMKKVIKSYMKVTP